MENTSVTSKTKTLVVVLHGYTCKTSDYQLVKKEIQHAYCEADILLPKLRLSLFSRATPNEVAASIILKIDDKWKGGRYDQIVLIGHSCGALLARKVYILACGETESVPFEIQGYKTARPWAVFVNRIILLAGMNRGWSANRHLSIINALLWNLGSLINRPLSLFRYRLFIFQMKKGAPFITQLRLQWLAMLEHTASHGLCQATVVQLLGTIDDLVSPNDNLDLITGNNFIYLDVPRSGHMNVVAMDETAAGRERAVVFNNALTLNEKELHEFQDHAYLHRLQQRPEVTDVVFVIHGIRDAGYWTDKIASKVQRLGHSHARTIETETSTYGYFPMLPFLLYSTRREKVEWLMDQYTENKALYPNAAFSFVGHSNGTYLLAKALEDYPACRFKHVVFAGSVVRQKYNWHQMIAEKRVQAVMNLVASADWVVAIFPKTFQMLRLQDLGSGGHDGFSSLAEPNIQLKYIQGSHGAGIQEDLWEAIANFIVLGTQSKPEILNQVSRQNYFVRIAGLLAPVFILFLISLLIGLGYFISCLFSTSSVIQTVALICYLIVLWKILTKI